MIGEEEVRTREKPLGFCFELRDILAGSGNSLMRFVD